MPPSASHDPAEIAKFAALASAWWNPDGEFAPLHRMAPARLSFIKAQAAKFAQPKTAKKPLEGVRILDLGCGGGLISVPLARLGARVTGADAGVEAIEAAKAYAREAGLDIAYRCAMAEDLAGETFDLVLALEIVEHVASVPSFLAAAANLSRPGGKLIVSTLNRTDKARAFAIVTAERILGWAPVGTHDFEKFVKPEELAAAAPDLLWDEPVGLSFDPLSRNWKLSRDVDINYFRAATRK